MIKYKFLTHDNTDPYFNLASEEYLLKHTEDFYFYLWINSPAVIVGVNQNALQEVNLSYTQENDIKVVRRLTGGGAVYHDKNNLCYTVISPYNESDEHYKKFTYPVIEYLNSLGVNACFSGRNDITIDGKKISGNAQTVYKNRIMHHGTLLFDSDLSVLEKALTPNKLKMESKGIKSVRARVTSIKDYLLSPLTINQFKDGLKEFFLKNSTNYEFTKKDIEAINKLVKEKYSTFNWNIGNSPKGKNLLERKFDFGVFSFSFDTFGGVIENAYIYGDFFCSKDLSEFTKTINGKRLVKAELLDAFSGIGEYIKGADGSLIVNELFK